MKVLELTLVFGVVLVSAGPALPQFVKAALGFRLGFSPTEHGFGQKGYAGNKKGVGVQLLTGVNNGGWHGGAVGRQLNAAGSGYGVGLGGREGPLNAHVGGGAVRHLKILGLNLYLGGRAAGLTGSHSSWKPQLAKKPYLAQYSQHQHQHYPVQHHQHHQHAHVEEPLIKGGIGLGLKPHHGPNSIGGAGGIRASVGTPGYGVGFNVGYRQGIKTHSPLGLLFGLGGGHKHHYSPYKGGYGQIYKGQDQVYVKGNGILKGHGHDNYAHNSPIAHHGHGGQSHALLGFPQNLESPIHAGLESKQHIRTQPFTAQPQQGQRQQGQFVAQPSTQRNIFGRPTILRPTPIQYTFSSPQALQSGPIRMVISPHPQVSTQQRLPNEAATSTPSWSTLFPVNNNNNNNGLQSAASNRFVNPIPANGQPLTKLQASLYTGPLTSAQNQIPFYQPQPQHQQQFQGQQQQQQFQGFPQHFPQQQGHFNQPQQYQHQQHQPNNFHSQAAPAAPISQVPQEYNLFQQLNSPLQPFQQEHSSNAQNTPHQSLIPQHSPFLTHPIQEHSLFPSGQLETAQQQHSPQSQNAPTNFPSLPQLPFTADSMPFAPEPGFQYTHSTVSDPVSMGSYSMNMDLGASSGENGPSTGAPASGHLVGPNGRRLKKKSRRQDSIIKKQDNFVPHHDMETSASNAITMASSLGSTNWTPMTMVDPPKFTKKSLDTTASDKKPTEPKQTKVEQAQLSPVAAVAQPSQIKPSPQEQSTSLFVPTSLTSSQERKHDSRTMILRRRLNLSGEVTSQTVLPTTIIPSTTTTSTTTTTTTSPPPSSSSSSSTTSAPSSSSSSTPNSEPTTSEASATTTVSA